jgi:hypothetical protein
MSLQGKARLSLFRKGIEVHRVEKKNTITGYVQNAITKGNFNMSIPNSAIMPLSQWFDGCVLISGTNDASLGMIAHNSDVVACAGNTADAGSTDIRRGNANTTETADITGGRSVFILGSGRVSIINTTIESMKIYYINE